MAQQKPQTSLLGLDREMLGKVVRDVWIEWANEQSNPKPSWLVQWHSLSESDKEVDRRIGERLTQYVLEQIVACDGCGKECARGEMTVHFCADCDATAMRVAQSEGPVVMHDSERTSEPAPILIEFTPLVTHYTSFVCEQCDKPAMPTGAMVVRQSGWKESKSVCASCFVAYSKLADILCINETLCTFQAF